MNKLSFSIDKYELEDIENSQFAKLRLYVCHDLDNKNGSYLSLDSIKQAERTLYNKPIIMKLNNHSTDFEQHEVDVVVVGVIPQVGHNIHYEEIGSRNYLVADAIIWKHYSSSTLEIFERDETKGISMEIQVFEEHAREEDGLIQIDSYAYLAVCLLGDRYDTGMYNTTAKVVGFSKEQAINDLKKEWMSFMKETTKKDKDSKLSSSERLSGRKKSMKKTIKEVKVMAVGEENRAELEEQIKNKVSGENVFEASSDEVKTDKEEMAKDVEADKEVDMSKETTLIDRIAEVSPDNFADDEAKEEKDEKETPESEDKEEKAEEFADKEEMCNTGKMSEDMSKDESGEDFAVKYADLMCKFEAMTETMAQKDDAMLKMNAEFMALKEEKDSFATEFEALKQFKADTEMAKMAKEMKDTFSTLTNVLSKEEIDEWKIKASKYDSSEKFEKDIKSFACDKLLKANKPNKTEFSNMSVDMNVSDDVSEDENIWDKLAKRVANQ